MLRLLWGSEKWLQRRQRLAAAEAVERRARFALLADTFYRYAGEPIETYEARLNHGRPFKRLPSPDGESVRCEWDASALNGDFAGWTVQFIFYPALSQSTRRGLECAKTIAPPSRYGEGPSYAALLAMEHARRAALLSAGGAWWLAFLTLLFARPWRRQLAQVCLAAALLAALAWLGDPLRTWDRADWQAPLPIAIAAAGVVSLVALVVPTCRPTCTSDQAPCTHCGYDLTGNESGICPECGRVTPRGRVDRWQDLATRISLLAACPEGRGSRPHPTSAHPTGNGSH